MYDPLLKYSLVLNSRYLIATKASLKWDSVTRNQPSEVAGSPFPKKKHGSADRQSQGMAQEYITVRAGLLFDLVA